MSNQELRSFATELRSVDVDGKRCIEGYATVWDTLSSYTLKGPRGPYREKMDRHAFDESINRGDDVGCYYNHDSAKILGRTRSGTLQVSTDDHGLLFRCELPDTSDARDLIALLDRGDVYGCSIGYTHFVYDWRQVGGELIGTIMRGNLFDVGPVTMPVYETTSVSLRSLEKYLESQDAARAKSWHDFANRRLRVQEKS